MKTLTILYWARFEGKIYNWSDWISYEGNPVAVGDEEKA